MWTKKGAEGNQNYAHVIQGAKREGGECNNTLKVGEIQGAHGKPQGEAPLEKPGRGALAGDVEA